MTYRNMIEALDLRTDLTMRRKNTHNNNSPSKTLTAETFQFLLFVLDTVENRKLTVDSSFYSATLILGAQEGGLHKRIAYYLSEGRKRHKEMYLSSGNASETAPSDMLWEELLLNYSTFKDKDDADTNFPLIRVSSKEFGRVLAAEQAVSYQTYATKR